MESDKNPDDTMSRAHRWHIPRPSLGGSSGAGGGSGAGSTAGGDQRARGGSASSQGSSSNHSTHSASSGSLLLSAANLARVHGNGRPGAYHANLSAYVDRSRRAGEHRRLHRTDGPQSNVSIPEEIVSTPSPSISPSPPASGDPFWSSGEFKLTSNRHMNKENALDSFSRRSGTTDPSLVEFPHHSTKTDPSGTEAADSSTSSVDPFWSSVKLAGGRRPASVASSTHFTVVNGFTRRTGKPEPRSYCCDASHQVTVLVVTMTVLISACILAAICFVEMRLRRDANFRFS